MYYKLVQNGEAVQVFNFDIDHFIELQNEWGEDNVEKIDEKEYNNLRKKFNEEGDMDNITVSRMTMNEFMGTKSYTDFEKKIVILNMFSQSQNPPTISQLNEYLNWLNE